MSEVKKWYIGVYGGEAQARPCSPAEFEIINEREGRYFVLKEDFDLIVAEREALQLRLTAADELNDTTKAELAWQESDTAELRKRVEVLEGLLRESSEEMHDFITCGLLDRIDAELKRTERVSDEKI